MRVFASVSSYLLGRLLGARAAEELITHAVREGELPQGFDAGAVPAVLTLHRLAEQFDVTLRVDGGATSIGKSRSRHLHAALESGCDAWVTVDDDVEASADTVFWLVDAVTCTPNPAVCIAPCLLRGDPTVANIEWTQVVLEHVLKGGVIRSELGRVRSAKRGGFGLVSMNRAALELVAASAEKFRDDDGELKPAAFREVLAGERWLGEDLAFFEQLPPGVTVGGLVTGWTIHAGHRLELATLSG